MTDISVIIPTYNHAHFLEECLASVYGQGELPIEIIVVDDGSTDGTAEIAAKHSGRIQYIYKDNAGLSAARNTGVAASSGRYIQFLDADDLLAPNCLSQKLQLMQREEEKTILVCRSRLFSDIKANGKMVKSGDWRLYTSNLNTHLCRLNIAPPHAFFIPRALIQSIKGFDESYRGCEDYDFWLRALGAGYDFRYCPDALVYYRKHVDSMGKNKARAGIYPFDVLVHKKKHEGEYGISFDSLLERPDGSLALTDGALVTALLISSKANPTGQSELLNMACTRLERALELLSDQRVRMNLESKLYMKRILLKKSAIGRLGNTNLTQLLESLDKERASLFETLRGSTIMFPFTKYEQQALLSVSIQSVIGDVLKLS